MKNKPDEQASKFDFGLDPSGLASKQEARLKLKELLLRTGSLDGNYQDDKTSEDMGKEAVDGVIFRTTRDSVRIVPKKDSSPDVEPKDIVINTDPFILEQIGAKLLVSTGMLQVLEKGFAEATAEISEIGKRYKENDE